MYCESVIIYHLLLTYLTIPDTFVLTIRDIDRKSFAWNIFTARKRSLRRVCFHKCLSVHRGRGVCHTHPLGPQADTPIWADTSLGKHPYLGRDPPGRHPPGQTCPPGRHPPGQTPPGQTPPSEQTPTQADTPGHTPPGHTPPLGRHLPRQTPPLANTPQVDTRSPRPVHAGIRSTNRRYAFLLFSVVSIGY